MALLLKVGTCATLNGMYQGASTSWIFVDFQLRNALRTEALSSRHIEMASNVMLTCAERSESGSGNGHGNHSFLQCLQRSSWRIGRLKMVD